MLLAGCATSPVPANKADPVPSNRLYAFIAKSQLQLLVTRDSGLYGLAVITGCTLMQPWQLNSPQAR